MEISKFELEAQATACEYTYRIGLKKKKLDEDTLHLYQAILKSIKTKLKSLDCYCHKVGKDCEIFGFLSNWKCSNCTRISLFVKQIKYENQYEYAINHLSSVNPRESIQKFIGVIVQRPFDCAKLIELLEFQKKYIHNLWSILDKEQKRFYLEYRRTGILEPSKRKQISEFQLQSERTANLYTHLIRLRNERLDQDTLNLHKLIRKTIKDKLKSFNCKCHQVGKDLEIFGHLYNFYCSNCSRKSLIIKYKNYQIQYNYAIERLRSETPREFIEQFIDAGVLRTFDAESLIEALEEQKQFIHSLWSIAHEEQKVFNTPYREQGILGCQKTKIIFKEIKRNRRNNQNLDPNVNLAESQTLII